MYSREQYDLWEAYQGIYQPQELTEEVEIAAQYFYEMGLNEDGVEIVIEELGVEEFAEWVYDIAEDYYLTERKLAAGETTLPARSRERIGGRSAASRKFSDPEKKSTAGGKRRAARAAAREEGQPEETPRQARIKELRAKAARKATEKQPKKQGLLDRVAGAVNRGIEAAQNRAAKDIERRKQFMSAARETVAVAKKAAGKVGDVARETGKGASGTLKLAGHLATKGLGEEVEAWVNALVEEGYDLSEYTWEDMTEMYVSEGRGEGPRGLPIGPVGKGFRTIPAGRQRQAMMKRAKTLTRKAMEASPEGDGGRGSYRGQMGAINSALENPRLRPQRESFDLFDTILEYLVSEGFADTNENALVIMANMSEEWRESIVEGKKEIPNVTIRKQMKRKLRSDKPKDWENVGYMSGMTGVPVPKH